MKNLLNYGLIVFLTWANTFVLADGLPFDIEYSVYMKDKGWGEWEQNGATAGKWDERLEALRIRIVNRNETVLAANCSIHYRAHVPGLGWLDWVQDGETAGKIEDYPELQSQSRRLEAVEVKLENCSGWDVSYRVHIINRGWTEAHRGGVSAGTVSSEESGEAQTLVAFKMVLLPEGCNETWHPSVSKSQGNGRLREVAWSNSLNQFVVAGFGPLYTSSNVSDWELQDLDFKYQFVKAAWGSDRWISVGSSNYNYIYWSLDGITWTKQEMDIPGSFRDVYWSNGLWIILGGPGGMVTSSDGINWQSQSIDVNDRFSALASNGKSWIGYASRSEDGKKILVSENGMDWTPYVLDMDAHKIFWDGKQWILISLEYGVFSSDDGINWQYQSYARPYGSVAIATNDEMSISVGIHGIYISYDSYVWTKIPSFWGDLYDVIWNGEKWLAVGYGGKIITSSDGINWYDKTNGHPFTYYIKTISGTSDYWVMGAGSYGIYKSSDGINWQEQLRQPGLSINELKWNGRHWLAMATQYSLDESVPLTETLLSSSDGEIWTQRYLKEDESFSQMEWDGEHWVVFGRESRLLLNSDATQLQEATHDHPEGIDNMLWNGKVWVAIGLSRQSVYYSANAIDWVIVNDLGADIDTTLNHQWYFSDIEWNGEKWMIVGGRNNSDKGIVLTSINGRDWQSQIVPDSGRLWSVANNGKIWLVIGKDEGGRYFLSSSEDGLEWKQQISLKRFEYISGVQWNGYQWLAIASGGQIFTSSDGISWQKHIIDESEEYSKIVWNGKQWLILESRYGHIYVNRCSIGGGGENNCVTQAAHYEEATAMLHIDQLIVPGSFGTQTSVIDISLQNIPELTPLAFTNSYLDTPENSLLCADESATLDQDGQLHIPSFKYTSLSGSEKIFNDVIFQLDETNNTLNLNNASEIFTSD